MRNRTLGLISWMLSCLAARAAEVPALGEPVYELPKYTVTNELLLPKPESWRYTTIPGFEVLSCASRSSTQHFLKDFQLFQQVIDVVWPGIREAAAPVPGLLVIYGNGREAGLLDSAVRMAGEDILEITPLTPEEERWSRASRFFGDAESACIVVSTGAGGNGMADPYRQFYREYVRFLFNRVETRSAPWVREGVARLLAGMDFTDKWIKFTEVSRDRFDDFNTVLGRAGTPASANSRFDPANPTARTASSAAVGMGAFPSIAEMLQANDAGFAANPWFRHLSHAFVHMCLYGRGQRYQKPFMVYLAKTDGGPGSEAVFKECFGMSYKQMQDEIVGYVSFTDYKNIVLKAEKGQVLATPPPAVLRDATQAEVGRIKGQGLVLSGRSDLARATLLAPYIRKEADANLLAALGLYEVNFGRRDRARSFLESAAQGGARRPRAYLELARMRRIELDAKDPARATAAPAVLEPLRTAAGQEPLLREVFEMMIAEWSRDPALPPAGDLALLEKGAVRFQRNLKLVYDTAQLLAAANNPRQAARFADWGMRNAQAPRDKERFAQLLATLPAAPAGK